MNHNIWQFGLEMNPQHRHFGLGGGWFGLEEAGEGSSMEVEDIGGDVNAPQYKLEEKLPERTKGL